MSNAKKLLAYILIIFREIMPIFEKLFHFKTLKMTLVRNNKNIVYNHVSKGEGLQCEWECFLKKFFLYSFFKNKVLFENLKCF